MNIDTYFKKNYPRHIFIRFELGGWLFRQAVYAQIDERMEKMSGKSAKKLKELELFKKDIAAFINLNWDVYTCCFLSSKLSMRLVCDFLLEASRNKKNSLSIEEGVCALEEFYNREWLT